MSRIKQVSSWEKHPKPKTAELVMTFQRAFRKVWLCFGIYVGGFALAIFIDKQIVDIPDAVAIIGALAISVALLTAIFLVCFGKARCPNCGQLPLRRSGLAAGIPLRIDRCSRCDYPLCMEELQKDLKEQSAAERRAGALSSTDR